LDRGSNGVGPFARDGIHLDGRCASAELDRVIGTSLVAEAEIGDGNRIVYLVGAEARVTIDHTEERRCLANTSRGAGLEGVGRQVSDLLEVGSEDNAGLGGKASILQESGGGCADLDRVDGQGSGRDPRLVSINCKISRVDHGATGKSSGDVGADIASELILRVEKSVAGNGGHVAPALQLRVDVDGVDVAGSTAGLGIQIAVTSESDNDVVSELIRDKVQGARNSPRSTADIAGALDSLLTLTNAVVAKVESLTAVAGHLAVATKS